MRPDQKRVFNNIIAGFEENYQKILREDDTKDTPLLRVAFYNACLGLVRDGPRLKSRTVQYELGRYYDHMLDKELRKVERIKPKTEET